MLTRSLFRRLHGAAAMHIKELVCYVVCDRVERNRTTMIYM